MDASRFHLQRRVPVVKSEPVQGGWPLHISQSTDAKHLCQIPGTFETNAEVNQGKDP